MLPKKLVFAIALLTVGITFLPLAVSEDATNSMASMQREIDELKSALAKLEKKEHVSPLIKFAGRVDDEAKAAKEIVAQQLEAVNVFGNAMKFQSNGGHLRVRNAQEGLDIEHDGAPEEVLTVRANLPIPLPFKRNAQTTYIGFYYEVELVTAEPFTIVWVHSSDFAMAHPHLIPPLEFSEIQFECKANDGCASNTTATSRAAMNLHLRLLLAISMLVMCSALGCSVRPAISHFLGLQMENTWPMLKLIFAIFFPTILSFISANFPAKSAVIHPNDNDQSIQSNFPCTGYADFDCGLGELRVRCIPSLWLCDNVFDCSTGQDEAKCSYLHKCPPGTLICSNGDCILAQQRCDGKMQCLDGSERGCFVGEILPFPWGKKNFPHQNPSAGPYSSSAIFHRSSHQNSPQQIQQNHQNSGKNANSDAIEMAAHFDRWLSRILTLLLAFLIFGQILVLAIVLRRRKNQRQNRRSQRNAGNGNGGLRRTRVRFVAVGFKAAGISHPKKEMAKEEEEEEDDICSIFSE